MRRVVSCVLLVLLLTATFMLALNVGLVNAQATVYINSDGSISPSSAPISSIDNVTYTFIGNVSYPTYNGIVVERNSIVIDGNGYTVQGSGSGATGISLTGISNVIIKNINIEDFNFGIYLSSSSNDTVFGTKITANPGIGIRLDSSSNNTISENSITDIWTGIAWEPWIGAWLISSSNNTVSENNITGWNWGISLMPSSSFNMFSGNNITDNDEGIVLGYAFSGLYLGDCTNNTIYHNNFIDNYLQAASGGSNIWDNGYPSGGNYWNDYNGTDLYSGPYQNVTGSDEIGDTTYVIDANNMDHYPLMKPYPWGAHDVGVTHIARVYKLDQFHVCIFPPKTIGFVGISLHLDVFVMNYGDYPEALNLTVYANDSIVGQVSNVTLAAKNSTFLDFLWNTSAVAKGNYTISAYLEPVAGETDIKDNNYTDGTIKITIPGDVDGDGKVDIRDIHDVAIYYGATPLIPNWNSNADINDDGKIDIKDVHIAAANYGQHYP